MGLTFFYTNFFFYKVSFWGKFLFFSVSYWNLYWGVDILSFFFLLVVFLISPSLIFVSPTFYFEDMFFFYIYIYWFFLTTIFFLVSFDFILLFLFYELTILPLFLILYYYGTYYRRVQAALFFFIWALFGSLFLFIGVVFIFSLANSTYFSVLLKFPFSNLELFWLNFVFFIGFGFKIPIWPLYYWLPRAHAEAPTNVSIFLSGVLVKLSFYGYWRLLTILGTDFVYNFFFLFVLCGVFEPTLKMFAQVDLKCLVALSTTVQMNYIMFSVLGGGSLTLKGSFIIIFNHALTAALLFLSCDFLISRYNTREFFFLVGLGTDLPILSFFFLLVIINQIHFPFTVGFIGDLLIVSGALYTTPLMIFILFFYLFTIEHLVIFYIFAKMLFGVLTFNKVLNLIDISRVEFYFILYFLVLSFLGGVYPFFFDFFFSGIFFFFFRF